jgi:hypothetical protein
MNGNSETVTVAAANKVAKIYGKQGLLEVMKRGGPTARSMAARWLVNYSDQEVERSLIEVLRNGDESYVVVRVLWTLKDIGTPAALPAVSRAAATGDSSVADMARQAEEAIRLRSLSRRP